MAPITRLMKAKMDQISKVLPAMEYRVFDARQMARALKPAMEIAGRDIFKIFQNLKRSPNRVQNRRHTVHAIGLQEPQKEREEEKNPSGHLWCTCRRMSFDDMVACDNQNCPIQWFHMTCVNMTMANVPLQWFCDRCRCHRRRLDNFICVKNY